MASGGGVDPAVMAEKEAEIEAAKKALEDMQRDWETKLSESKAQTELTIQRKSMLHVGTNYDGISPFIGNLNDDPLLTGKVKYGFPAGKELLIGRPGGVIEEDEEDDIEEDPDEEVDIAITGEGVFEKMCRVANKEGKVSISSHGAAAHAVFINGVSLAEHHHRQTVQMAPVPSQEARPKMRGTKSKTGWVEMKHGDRVGMGRLLFIFCVPPNKIQDLAIDATKYKAEHQSGILHEAGARFHQYHCMQRMATGLIQETEAKVVDTSDPVAVAAELSILHSQIEKLEMESRELQKLRDENVVLTQEVIKLRAEAAKIGVYGEDGDTDGEPQEDPMEKAILLAGQMLEKFAETIEKVDYAKQSMEGAEDKVDKMLSKPSGVVVTAFKKLGLM